MNTTLAQKLFAIGLQGLRLTPEQHDALYAPPYVPDVNPSGLRGTGGGPQRPHVEPPASANAELRANPISKATRP